MPSTCPAHVPVHCLLCTGASRFQNLLFLLLGDWRPAQNWLPRLCGRGPARPSAPQSQHPVQLEVRTRAVTSQGPHRTWARWSRLGPPGICGFLPFFLFCFISLFCFSETGSGDTVQAALNPQLSCLSLQSAGQTGVHPQAWLLPLSKLLCFANCQALGDPGDGGGWKLGQALGSRLRPRALGRAWQADRGEARLLRLP